MQIKNLPFYLLAVPLLLAGGSAVAQPTVPVTSFPVIRDYFELTLSDSSAQPGAGGANATWNFGSIPVTANTQKDSFLSPSATPYGALFPTADVAVHEVNPVSNTNYYIYYRNDGTNSVYQRLGNVQPDTVIYSDQSGEFPYPLVYNGTYSDTYYAQFQRNGLLVHNHGTVSETVDGYGTITTPAGTYTNVVRTHATRSELDTGFAAVTLAFDQRIDYFNWYQSDSYFPIMTIVYSTRHLNGTFFSKSVGYRQGYDPTGVKDVASSDHSVMLYPNPASQKAMLVYNMAAHGESVISVYDMTGRMLVSHSHTTAEGIQTYTLDISALPAGLYDVRIVNAEGVTGKKLQVVR